jgi:hypothetical protein
METGLFYALSILVMGTLTSFGSSLYEMQFCVTNSPAFLNFKINATLPPGFATGVRCLPDENTLLNIQVGDIWKFRHCIMTASFNYK